MAVRDPGCRTVPAFATLLLAVLLSAATGCVSSSDIDALGSRITSLQRQVAQAQEESPRRDEVAALGSSVTGQLEALLKSEAEMRADLAALSGQIAELRGELEATSFRLGQLSQQIAATQQELRARTPASEPGANAPAAPGTEISDPESLYQNAYGDYLRGNYDLARMAFEQYLASFPDTDLSDNATYWIAECHYRQGRFDAAIAGYDLVLSRYPRSDKTASALLKRAYALIEKGERQEGIAQLQRLIRQFPSSDETNLARQRLRALGVDR